MAKKAKPIQPKLVKALDFLGLLFKAGNDQSMYCNIAYNKAVAFNLIVAAGTTIDEDLHACPHIDLFAVALSRAGLEYQVTQLSSEKLLVRSADFHAYIPCILGDSLSWPIPDAPVAALNDSFIDALTKVAPLVDPKGETVLVSSIQLNGASCIATNRSVIIEAWHGNDMPSGLLIPRAAANLMNQAFKQDKKLTSFGFSKETFTVYYHDDSWIRTQLFQDRPTNIVSTLNIPLRTRAVPQSLFDGAKKVAPFSGDGRIYVKDGFVSSHRPGTQEQGSELKLPIEGEHAARAYEISALKLISKHAELWDEYGRTDSTYFAGKNLRGLIAHDDLDKTVALEDNDIPF